MTTPTTFQQFVASRKEVDDVSALSGWDEVPGYVYLDSFYIVKTTVESTDREGNAQLDTDYIVEIGRNEYSFGDDLEAAEKLLWDEFAAGEKNWQFVRFDTEFGFQLDQRQVLTLIEKGFTDESWHNDICPSFDKVTKDGHIIRIWFDAPDAKDRECEGKQFTVCKYNADMDMRDEICHTDSFDEALQAALIATRFRPVVWSFDGSQSYRGFTDDTHWNGFLNIWVTAEVHGYVLEDFSAGGLDDEFKEMTPDELGLYSYAYGYCTFEDEDAYHTENG